MAEEQKRSPGQRDCPAAATTSAASSGAYDIQTTESASTTPGKPEGRFDLIRLLSDGRLPTYERARQGHHEPVFARNLGVDHDQLLSILGVSSPTAVEWVRQNSRVTQTLASRVRVVAGTADITF